MKQQLGEPGCEVTQRLRALNETRGAPWSMKSGILSTVSM